MINKEQVDFIVIGSQKCATTWIYDCLKNHPRLNLRNTKNENAYYGGKMFLEKGGNDWYFKQFDTDSAYPKGCVSVEYIEDAASPRTMLTLNPDLKIIASLRHPAKRAVSAYEWYVRKAFIPDLPLNDGINEMLLHFEGKIINQYTNAYKNIIDRGFFATRLQQWYKQFPSNQVKINFFDEVQLNPLQAIKDIMMFLQTDASYVPANINTIPKKNTGFAPLIKLERKFPKSRVVSKISDIGNQLLFKNRVKSDVKKIDAQTMQKLNLVYESSLQDLFDLFSRYNISYKDKMQQFWFNVP